MNGIHAHFMIQILMYCWNLRKLCMLLDERSTINNFAPTTEDLGTSATLSEDVLGFSSKESEIESEAESLSE